jgi:RimJ/RimL family protein N-acetyltransferase
MKLGRIAMSDFAIIDIHSVPEHKYNEYIVVLWELLLERDHTINISHKNMPKWENHAAFINSRPYRFWGIIEVKNVPVGAVYLTKRNEIGIFILKEYQRHGYGRRAVQQIRNVYDNETLYANINVNNDKSKRMFTDMGFRLLSETYKLDPIK